MEILLKVLLVFLGLLAKVFFFILFFCNFLVIFKTIPRAMVMTDLTLYLMEASISQAMNFKKLSY